MDVDAAFQQGFAHQRAGRLADAKRAYTELLGVAPNHFDTLHALALVDFQLGNPAEGLTHLAHALEINPSVPPAHFNHGLLLNQMQRYDEAAASFGRAIALNPNYAAAYLSRGRCLGMMGRFAESIEDFDRAILLDPNNPEAHNDLGKTLAHRIGLERVLPHFERAIALNPNYAEAHANHASTLVTLGQDAEAIESFRRVISLKPDADTHKNLAAALRRCGRLEEALTSFDDALALDPNCAATHNNRGATLEALGRHDNALASFQRAIALDPANVEAHVNASAVLIDNARYAEGIEACDRAIALNSNFGAAYGNRGVALDRMGRIEEAIEAYGKAITLDPGIEIILGRRFYFLMRICRWDGIDGEVKTLLRQVDAGHLASPPFCLLMAPSTPAQQQAIANLYSAKKVAVTGATPLPRRQRGAKLRVGYFSADFHTHAVTHLTAGLFEVHDRARFDIVGFAFGAHEPDDMTRRLEKAFDRFIDLRSMSDREAANLAREMDIDIAVDLTGHTLDSRPGIFAHRAAPIQVSYLGYPGTVGLDAMDYIIADPVLMPAEHRPFYSEKIALLPSYQVNDSKRARPEHIPTRAQAGLPDGGFVFCGFNNTYKITPREFDIWMRLLHKVAGSVLWLREGPAVATGNLRKEAERRGIDPARLIFAPRAAMTEHLARHGAADLFLDTLTYNAHTTASDALWMGLPMITMLGDTFPGRVSASLLTALGLPALITRTPAEYEDLALELATHPTKLAALKQQLRDRRTTSPLFDTAHFARRLEAAYGKMWEIHERTGGAEDFAITD